MVSKTNRNSNSSASSLMHSTRCPKVGIISQQILLCYFWGCCFAWSKRVQAGDTVASRHMVVHYFAFGEVFMYMRLCDLS